MELRQPSSLAEVEVDGGLPLAGGTEVVPLCGTGSSRPRRSSTSARSCPKGVRGTTIGAGTVLAELEADPEIPEALREACRLAASPQLRSMGTIGGNLLQATRCWYWRLKYPCFLHGGSTCHAREGEHREHAIFGNERCASAHPSDPAAALLALGATLRTDRRELPIAELYRLPTDDDRDVTALEPGELILELEVPHPEASRLPESHGPQALGVPAGWGRSGPLRRRRPPRPWPASLRFRGLLESADDLERATPLPGTAYKVELARPLIRRALEAVG